MEIITHERAGRSKAPIERELYSPSDIGAYLGISRETVYRRVLPNVRKTRIGARVYVARGELDAFVAEQTDVLP